jgi:hypothetical protein
MSFGNLARSKVSSHPTLQHCAPISGASGNEDGNEEAGEASHREQQIETYVDRG